ncbi:universal stress protein [Lacinutrix cladophorae]
MKKNILIPTDFSDNAWSAIVYVLKLYAKESCTFYFFNTINNEALAQRSLVTGHFLEELKTKAWQELLDLKELAMVSNDTENHDFEIVLSTEKLTSAILNTIKEYQISLVVMGTKGASNKDTIFFGSNTISVFKNIKSCPVLIVPDEYDFVKPKKVAFPTDYNRFYKDTELEALSEITQLYNATIKIIHIQERKELSKVQQYNLNQLDRFLQDFEHSFHWMPNYAKKATVINDFIEELSIDLLAIVNYQHSFIENLIKEPVVKNIGSHPIIPLLVIPE